MNKTWSELGTYQEEYAYKVACLILWARTNNINVRIKDAGRDERVHGKFGEKGINCPHCKQLIKSYSSANSVHKLSLAVDLFTKNEADHIKLHDQWDRLGGAHRIERDMNHYSFEWNGNW